MKYIKSFFEELEAEDITRINYDKKYKGIYDDQVEELADQIYYRLEEEFEGQFFPLMVVVDRYEDNHNRRGGKTSYAIGLYLGPSWSQRLGEENIEWIEKYLDHLKPEMDKYNCSTFFCAYGSMNNCFYKIKNEAYPEEGEMLSFIWNMSTGKLHSNRKSHPED